MTATAPVVSASQVRAYREDGYLVVGGLYDRATAAHMIDHYMALRAEGPKPGDTGGTADHPEDPNHRYPRIINMHDWDAATRDWARRAEVLNACAVLLGQPPVLRQTMLYFKPPGGRGQGLHQDEQYITMDPLVGFWVALDRSDRAVGQMVVVPGSHRHGLLPVEAADTSVSFTKGQAAMPEGAQVVGLDMEPGDALFFDGRTIHGSYANATADRWRRSFICHYVGERAQTFAPEPGTHMSHLPA